MDESTILIDMLKNSNNSLMETIASFQKELQNDIKAEFKSVREDIKELDEKVQKNVLNTSNELFQIKGKIETLVEGQEKQDKLIDDIRVRQLQCPAGNNWDTIVKVVEKHNNELKNLDDDITGIHAIEKLKRSSNNPGRKSWDVPRWLPLLIAIITAAGIIGGAAAIKLARSDEANSVVLDQKALEYQEEAFDLDTDYYTGDLD